jgi:hemerythrin-like domain-containing protein
MSANAKGSAGNPLDVILQEHRWQEKLCDALERIADDLPDNVDRMLVAAVLPMLRVDLAVHVRDEEDGLFPLMRGRSRPEDNFDEIAEVLSLEHAADAGFADEIIDQLEDLRDGRRPLNPDMLGYMLRGFFETQRRHLAWEDAVVLPLARARLRSEDLRQLSAVMLENRKSRQVRAIRRDKGLFDFNASDER